MSENSYLSNALYAADDKAEYDAGAKKILADKQVLAWILKYCVKEFKEYSIHVIKDYIEGTPEVSKVNLFPRKVTSEAITGMSDSDDVPNEGGIRFDIRFYAITPEGEHIKLIIDLEAQKNFYPGYSITARGVFYGARMISAQYGVEFVDSDYDSIKKVYSIWICMNAPKYGVNTITEYTLQPQHIYGKFQGKMKYDLLSIVIIGMGSEEESKEGSELHQVLSVLLSRMIGPAEKEKDLRDKYGFDIGHEMKGVWREMCNLSDLIEEEATARGLEKGMARGMAQGMAQGMEKGTYLVLCKLVHSGKLSKEDAAATAGISLEEFESIMEDEAYKVTE